MSFGSSPAYPWLGVVLGLTCRGLRCSPSLADQEGFPRTKATVNFVEFYNMSADPWQLHNAISTLDKARVAAYETRLYQLMGCTGAASCG